MVPTARRAARIVPLATVTDDAFSGTLKQIIDAAGNNFDGIKGDFNLQGAGNNRWKTTLRLPGAVSCEIIRNPEVVGDNFRSLATWSYSCDFGRTGSVSGLLADYEALVGLVGRATGRSFIPVPGNPAVHPTSRQVWFGAHPGIVVLANPDYIGNAWALELSVSQDAVIQRGSATAQPMVEGSSAAPTTIRAEIDEIERSGQFTPMPVPTRTSDGSVTGNVTQEVTNGTRYELRVLYSGPLDRDLVIQPGATQSIVLPPGSYRVAAKVSSSAVRPYYGVQPYLVGSYTSRFYIQ
jgi:hypothetical protein